MSRVSGQSNSFTVHFTCSSTSSRSSTPSSGAVSPRYSSRSSAARVVNGVWTSVTSPSLSSHFLGMASRSSMRCTRSARPSFAAAAFSRSIVCSSRVSLCSSAWCARWRSAGPRPAARTRLASAARHRSSSLYSTSKSAADRGSMRRRTSRRAAASAASALASWARRAAAARSWNARRSPQARRRARYPRQNRCSTTACCFCRFSSSSEPKYSCARSSRSRAASRCRSCRAICVPASRLVCWPRVRNCAVCVSRLNRFEVSFGAFFPVEISVWL
mmetsp:Transcript_2479/g.4208  ORF Transcript_2479/g.4208 Transcript_2479/m.4208 type:complete len:274 (-) Transcript_2479:338-1159(-)